MLGGLLVGVGGSRAAFAADAATFVVSAVLLRRLPPLPPTSPLSSGIWKSVMDGLRYVHRSRALRRFVIGTVVFVAFAAIDNVALVFLVQGRLGGSATAFGLVQACFGVGMLAVSIALGTRRSASAPPLLLAGAGATAVGSLLTAFAPSLLAAGGAQTVAGAGNAMVNVASTTYLQQLVPPPMLGRVFGALGTSAQVGSSLAYAAGAPLVASVGPRNAFTVAAVGATLGLLILLTSLRAGQRAFRT